MVRRFHRSIYDELDDLRASMDYLYQLALEPADNPLLPEGRDPGIVCRSVHNLDAEVAEHDDEVTVTIDTAPGTGTSKISVDLINETLLGITVTREEDRADDDTGNGPQKYRAFSMHHVITLPCPVVPGGAKSGLRNGVLDIHLKKNTGYNTKKA